MDKVNGSASDVIYNHNACASCGVDIPEGRMICPTCERRHKAKERRNRQTICWECSRLDCPWMQDSIPVKGWIAEPSVIKNKNGDIKSFCVMQCPMYEKRKKMRVVPAEAEERLLPKKVYAIRDSASGLYLKNQYSETILFNTDMEARSYIYRCLPKRSWDVVEYTED